MKKHISIIITILSIFSSNIIAQDIALWGMTSTRFASPGGAIFKTNPNGTDSTIIYKFTDNSINREGSSLTVASNGLLYGFSNSYIYSFNPIDSAYNIVFELDNLSLKGRFIEYENGILYGIHSALYSQDCFLVKFDINTNNLIQLTDFPYLADQIGELMLAGNGKIYGMTKTGGVYDNGTIFEYDVINDTIIKKVDFNGFLNGMHPNGGLYEAGNGNLFGVTKSGGIDNYGVIFKYNYNTNTFLKLHDFSHYSFGYPSGTFIEAENGVLLGLFGGNSCGIYSYNYIADTIGFQKNFNFYSSNPEGSLIQLSDGTFCGIVRGQSFNYDGETYYKGVIFKYDINTNDITTYYIGDLNNGLNFEHELVMANNGKIYGNSHRGGNNRHTGVFFEYDLDNEIYQKIANFGWYENGYKPKGSLLHASDGNLYGYTSKGGDNNYGVLFKVNPISTEFTKITDFENGVYNFSDDSFEGTLIEVSPGKLFGMNTYEGDQEMGCIFEYDINTSIYTVKYYFGDIDYDGANPQGNLLKASNGILYGMTEKGGGYDLGIVFSFDPITEEYTKIQDLEGIQYGRNPTGGFVEASNGKLYGLCKRDFSTYSIEGVIIEYDLETSTLSSLSNLPYSYSTSIDFSDLVEYSSGLFYGVIMNGGSNNAGALYEFNLVTNTIEVKQSFTNTLGIFPYGKLMLASNGQLYGMCSSGGSYEQGTIYEYNPTLDTIIKIYDFGNGKGGVPYGSLLELCNPSETILTNLNLPDITGECIVELPSLPTATNDCGSTIYGKSSHVFPITNLGTTVVTWTYPYSLDTLSQTQNIIVYDSIAPTATNPDTIIVVCEANFPDPNPGVVADAADNCLDQPIVEWLSDVSDNNTNPETITRTYLVSDEADNNITVDQIIIILDNEASTNVGILNTNQVNASEIFTSTIEIEDVFNLASFELGISFDTAMLQANSVTLESFLGSTGRTIFPVANTIDNDNGIIDFAVLTLGDTPPGPDGAGSLLSIEWTTTTNIANDTTTDIIIENYQFAQPDGTDICVTPENSSLNIIPCDPHDLDCDCDVDIVDVTTAAYHYGTQIGDDLYDPAYDLDNDGDIDIIDLTMITYYYGWTCGSKSSIYLNTNNDKVLLSFSPTEIVYLADGTFELELNVENIQQLGGYELEFDFDPQAIQVLNVEQGSFLTSTNRKTFPVQNTINNNDGKINFAITTFGSDIKGASEAGALVKIRCKPLKSDFELPALSKAQLARIDGDIINYTLKFTDHIINSTSIIKTYPSPLTNKLNLQYQLASNGLVEFKFYNVNGSLVKSTPAVNIKSGVYSLELNHLELTSGIYLISMIYNGTIVDSKRIIVK